MRVWGVTIAFQGFRLWEEILGSRWAGLEHFGAVGYWNQRFWATEFSRDTSLLPLQLVLRSILSQMLMIVNPKLAAEQAKLQMNVLPPVEVLRMATVIVTVSQIALVYPFLQRYFVKSMMVGAIKG